MPFNGLATYDNFEGIGENVSDLVAFLAPFETPLLEVVGASDQPATNVKHEWLEDSLNPTTDVVSTAVASATGAGVLTVAHPGSFRVGDLVQLDKEAMLVTGVSETTTIGVTRAYGATAAAAHTAGSTMTIIGNAALEGEDTDEDRTTRQVRKSNYCQIMKVGVKMSGTAQAVGWIGTGDKLADAKVMRLRELLRDLEKTILLGRTDVASIGSDTARRTLAGIVCSLSTNVASGGTLTESALGNLLQSCYNQGSRDIDLIVAPPKQKRIISNWNNSRVHVTNDSNAYRNVVEVYESDFGSQRVIMNRWLPDEIVLALDSSRIKVVPLAGRSFRYEELAKGGDYVRGQIVGEYTLELRNEAAHGMLQGLA
jgi:hypothetical protein